MSRADTWTQTLLAIDVATQALRRELDAFFTGDGDAARLEAALALPLAAIPSDVLERAQHPLSVAAKDLRGSVRQVLDSRKLVQGSSNLPDWARVVDDGAREALSAFEGALANLLKDGAPIH